MDEGAVYGRSLAFPPRVGANGQMQWSQGTKNVQESIRIILLTEPGERLMNPRFGCGLKRMLFEPNTVATRRQIEEQIKQALVRWEPRIRLKAVGVAPDEDDLQAVIATIEYELIATRVEDRLNLRLQLGV